MSNPVDFVLKLKDMGSGGLAKFASSADLSFKRVDTLIAKTQTGLKELGRPVKLAVDTSALKSAHQDIDRMQRKMGGGAGGRGGILGMLGMSGSAAVGAAGLAAVVAGGGYSIGQAMKGSQQKASFEVLAGQKEGSGLYSDITKFAQDSIFGNELYKNAQTLLSFGINVKKVMPDLKMLGDISMGDAEKLGSLTLAFAQTQSAGKLMGQDLLQYVNAGFNPLQELSVMTGKSMASLKEKMSDGQISAEAVARAFEHATGPAGKFFQMTEKIAETPFGKWEALKGQVQGIALQFGTSLLPAVSKVLGVLPPLLESITPLLQKLVPIFSSIANIATTLLVPALKVVGSVLSVVLDLINPVLKGVEWVIDKVSGIFDDGRIEKTYDLAGDMSGKAYLAGVTDNVAKVPDVIEKAAKSPGITNAWKDIASKHGQAYADALKDNLQTFDFTIPVKIMPVVNNGKMSDFVVNADGSLGFAPAAKAPDYKDTPHTNAIWNNAFKTGNYKPVPLAQYKYMGSDNMSLPTMPKKPGFKEGPIKIAPGFFSGGDSYAGVSTKFLSENFKETGKTASNPLGTTNLDKLIGGDDSSSKAIKSGGLRSIVFHIDTVGVKGGVTIQAQTVGESAEEIEHIVTQAMNRVMDSINAPTSD